ncbi:PREDICTED: cyclin-B1-2-like [Camelina sativa]|uniref:Cyclin-B1-2-like n=1 Tax=Camelina sativa TaxID=90675 RepID=A0ABM1R9W4_CAMSA|nr:PREDICTED: cyclin-B1-2-like [Camelina sativa]
MEVARQGNRVTEERNIQVLIGQMHVVKGQFEEGLKVFQQMVQCPSMLAASGVYTPRCSLKKSPAWTDTLQFHTGYIESEIMDCSKLLAFLHSRCGESRLRAVYKKY